MAVFDLSLRMYVSVCTLKNMLSCTVKQIDPLIYQFWFPLWLLLHVHAYKETNQFI